MDKLRHGSGWWSANFERIMIATTLVCALLILARGILALTAGQFSESISLGIVAVVLSIVAIWRWKRLSKRTT